MKPDEILMACMGADIAMAVEFAKEGNVLMAAIMGVLALVCLHWHKEAKEEKSI